MTTFKEQYLALDNQGQIDLINEKMRERRLAQFLESNGTQQTFERVRVWNEEVMFIKEGHNQLTYKKELELNMLTEEFKEFLDATTLIERLDAIGDFLFVWYGVHAKLHLSDMRGFENSIYEKLCLSDIAECGKWLEDYLKLVCLDLPFGNNKIRDNDRKELKEDLLFVVTKSNWTKLIDGYVDKNGKFRKGESFVDPTHDLKKLIEKYELSE